MNMITIENDFLRAEISLRGAELRALSDKQSACEILKRTDDPDWSGCAPSLFPICGRLWEQTTTVDGQVYRMGTHGFASSSCFTVSERSAEAVTLTLTESAETLAVYPFPFCLSVTYSLSEASLETSVEITNRGTAPMPCSVGFHPGFRMPVGGEGAFDDAYLDFEAPTSPAIWSLSAGGYLLRGTLPYPLADEKTLPLSEKVFAENDSVFFEGTGGAVTLRSHRSARAVRLDYAPAPYLGLWKPVGSTAFLCIEPWYGCPDYDGISTALSDKRDMLHLSAGATHTVSYRISVS